MMAAEASPTGQAGTADMQPLEKVREELAITFAYVSDFLRKVRIDDSSVQSGAPAGPLPPALPASVWICPAGQFHSDTKLRHVRIMPIPVPAWGS